MTKELGASQPPIGMYDTTERVERLERSNRQLRAVVVALASSIRAIPNNQNGWTALNRELHRFGLPGIEDTIVLIAPKITLTD